MTAYSLNLTAVNTCLWQEAYFNQVQRSECHLLVLAFSLFTFVCRNDSHIYPICIADWQGSGNVLGAALSPRHIGHWDAHSDKFYGWGWQCCHATRYVYHIFQVCWNGVTFSRIAKSVVAFVFRTFLLARKSLLSTLCSFSCVTSRWRKLEGVWRIQTTSASSLL